MNRVAHLAAGNARRVSRRDGTCRRDDPRPIAGVIGAGKSTTAPSLLRDALQVSEFVNADAIAGGLSAFRPDSVAIPAGRAMLERMRHLADAQANFAFETTLASRSFAPWLARLKRGGYHVHVLFLWLESADLAVDRVAARVRVGGHDVPEVTVRRRYDRASQLLPTLFASCGLLADVRQLAGGPASVGRIGTRWARAAGCQPIALAQDFGGLS